MAGAVTVSGTTADGHSLDAEGLREISYASATRSRGARASYRASRLRVSRRTSAPAEHFQYDITNFEFVGLKPWRLPKESVFGLTVDLPWQGMCLPVTIIPAHDRRAALRRVHTLKGVEVTATVHVPAASLAREAADGLASALCQVLCVCRGTSVQYVAVHEQPSSGEPTVIEHLARIAKPYSPLNVIDPRLDGQMETKAFIECALPRYLLLRNELQLDDLISAYVDARLEMDFLEMRGVKLVVVLEMLKAAFVRAYTAEFQEYVIDRQTFLTVHAKAIENFVQDALKRANIGKRQRQQIADANKIRGLNRRSFFGILSDMCKRIDLPVDRKERQRVVASRNSLVHNGRFYCEIATAEDRKACAPLASPEDEFFYLVDFVDRFMLRLLGYTGAYINYAGDRRHVIPPAPST
jgi:hypothetical protein